MPWVVAIAVVVSAMVGLQIAWIVRTYRFASESRRMAGWIANLVAFGLMTLAFAWFILGMIAMARLSGASLGST